MAPVQVAAPAAAFVPQAGVAPAPAFTPAQAVAPAPVVTSPTVPAAVASVAPAASPAPAVMPVAASPAVEPAVAPHPKSVAAEASGFDSLFDGLGIEVSAPAELEPAVSRGRAKAAPTSRRAVQPQEPSPRRAGKREAKAAAPAPVSAPAPAPAPASQATRSPNRANAAFDRPASTPQRGRRAAARVTSLVAMSFAALLAVATSVPSLSLLSSADVQAMALASSESGRLAGQTLDTSGDAIASPQLGLESYKSQSIEEYAAAAGIRPEATFTNNPAGTIQWPFAIGVHIGDRFGYRDCAGCSSDHHGQDFNPGYGADIQAIADGVVSQSTDSGGSLGVVMMIDHVIDGEVVTSVYAHMVDGSRRFEVGDTVKVGDVIGETGNTGMSTGPHLHFEIRLGGINGEWTDPLEWLYANTN